MFPIVAILTAMILVGPAAPDGGIGGYFYALDQIDQDDRLYRITVDENLEPTVIPIGPPGQLGWPQVAGLAWDPDAERLFGYDGLLDVWLEINPSTGVATPLGPLGAFTLSLSDTTYNPHDGKIYGLTASGNRVYAIDQNTGAFSEVISEYDSGLAYVLDTTGGFDGLFTVGGSGRGLTLYIEPEWTPLILGGDVGTRRAMFWDPGTDTLYNYTPFTVNQIWVIHQVTGDEGLLVDWGDIGIDVIAVAYVPDGSPPPPICASMDSDGDGDIDLEDYRVFQECFTGPLP